MPAILIKEYTWRQSNDTVFINTPIIGNPKTVDLFAIKNYVKASYPPFIFEIFLWAEIVDEESECVLDRANRVAIFRLKKKQSGIVWPSLIAEDLDKDGKNERRSNALAEAERMIEERGKVKSDKRNKLQKQAVKAQINLDTAILNDIDMRRDSERKEAMKDFENWRSNIDDKILPGIEGKLQDNRKAYRPALKWFKNEEGELKSREMKGEEIFSNLGNIVEEEKNVVVYDGLDKIEETIGEMKYNSEAKNLDSDENNDAIKTKVVGDNSSGSSSSSSSASSDDEDDEVFLSGSNSTTEYYIRKINARRESEERKKLNLDKRVGKKSRTIKTQNQGYFNRKNLIFDEAKKDPVPLPRNYGIIDVKFSDRQFPTPARESNRVEEQEWLEKQAEARRQTGFIVEDLRPEELDPQWLKDKGDEFFKAGNYLGSISAYSHGIKLSPKMSSLYSNRSAAHYAIGNYLRCTEDCSKALELMVPHCKGNLESRAKCHARRGAALCKLSSPQHGIPELEAALKLDPDNASVKRDLNAARQYFDIRE